MGSAFSSCCGKKEAPQKKELSLEVVHLQGASDGDQWLFCDEYKLGEGGFGSVYWGKTTDGLQIAVKKLKAMSSKAEMEFAVEVEILGRAGTRTCWVSEDTALERSKD
ncbi:hypothetical protein HPP92_000177 [Vanilla planifolia]|uniref:Protein kinase domain-containing protein n=1 Tax=Vanilla planifolia TaxID=51239 RepID=A0A835RX01_VANPL|nr:hypothetical protein HPP92_000177 [Vanilla planifolia]